MSMITDHLAMASWWSGKRLWSRGAAGRPTKDFAPPQDQERLPRSEPERTAVPDPERERERGERLVADLAVRDILGETRQLRTKLLIASYDLFNEYDRAVGEAEFRKNVAYAFLGLIAALTWMQSPWWALLLIVSARLYVAGLGSGQAANDVVVQAVVAGLVTPLSITGAAGHAGAVMSVAGFL
ncbi:hypothetical protein GCM10010129_57500 [Streptomyces fumigatiscleroticus]|nr:hypothetical protein GCM10010129_57500 [Streptomyces fumigatiscleroticus]